MAEINVDLRQKNVNYPIKIEKGLLNKIGQEIQAIFPYRKIVLVTDENVDKHYGQDMVKQLEDAGYDLLKIVLKPGEESKSLKQLADLYGQLIDFKLSRSDLIIALGGGVIGDLAGYLAASYLRGLKYVQIPTTLLAQVDSSVGGKVAVDLPQGKNLVGAFHHPSLVLIDPNVLNTLEDATFSDGMAEVIKYGCIKDKSFFKQLQSYENRQAIMEDIVQVIERCCTIKRDVVQNDEKDTGERMLLNYGHTIGHAIESYYHYQKYTHGQAIAIGMLMMNQLSGFDSNEIKAIFQQYNLPTELEEVEDYPAIIELISRDKKNLHDSLYVIVLEQLGQAVYKQVDYRFFDPLSKKEVSV